MVCFVEVLLQNQLKIMFSQGSCERFMKVRKVCISVSLVFFFVDVRLKWARKVSSKVVW